MCGHLAPLAALRLKPMICGTLYLLLAFVSQPNLLTFFRQDLQDYWDFFARGKPDGFRPKN
jgi:hypothetical protein